MPHRGTHWVIISLVLFLVPFCKTISPGGGCRGCDTTDCCFRYDGHPTACRNETYSETPYWRQCCWDGTVCPFCGKAGNNYTCCTYLNNTDEILHCEESQVCNVSSYGLVQCISKMDQCASCEGTGLCCQDWRGNNVSCRPDQSYKCCADGTACPYCTTACCSSDSYTGRTYTCPAYSTCNYDDSEQSLMCSPLENGCSDCPSGEQCCVVDFFPEICLNFDEYFCCRDGNACPKSICNKSRNLPPGECCNGAQGLFCPGIDRGYERDEIYCTWSTNIASCSKFTRKMSCSECETGEECCQDITGKFSGCYDPTSMTCCVIDGTNCPNSPNTGPESVASVCPAMGPGYGVECCNVVVNGTSAHAHSCPTQDNPTWKYCSPNGGCQANPRPPLPPEWSDFTDNTPPSGSPSPGSPSSGMILDMFWGGVLSGIVSCLLSL